MQQRDDVWSREYSECASWVPVVHIPPTDVTDSFRAPKRLKTPSGSHIHPNNTDYRLQTTSTPCCLLSTCLGTWSRTCHLSLHCCTSGCIHPFLLTQCGGSWCFNPPLVFTSFPSQSRLRSFTAWLLSVGSRPRWGLLDARSETNERIKTQ